MLLLILFYGFCVPFSAGQSPLDGRWEGAIEHKGSELKFRVVFKAEADGLKRTIDIPDLYIHEFKLSNIRFDSSSAHFELPLSRKPDTFDGSLMDGRISGSYSGAFFKGNTLSVKFYLERKQTKASLHKREEVRFRSGEVTLAGTLFTPLTKGPHPAIVFLHGSGPQTRDSYLRFFADLFVKRGIAALIYDKRGTGASTGEVWYKLGDRFEELVGDALAGVHFLKTRQEIHHQQIALWGLSQGAWLAPMAVSRTHDVAFIIVVSGGGVTPAEQELYDDEVKLRDMGFSPDQVAEAVALLRLADDVIRKREPLEKFITARAEAEKQAWFAHLDRYPAKLPKEDPTWQAGGEGLDFDPRPLWEKLKIPVLAIFGGADKSTPTQESVRRVELSLRKAGNKDYTIRIFPKADHALWVSPKEGGKWDWDRPASGWLEAMSNWTLKRVSAPKIASGASHR